MAKKLHKAYPYIHQKATELLKEGILQKSEVGRSYLCSVNLSSEKAVVLLTLHEIKQKEKIIKKKIISRVILEELHQLTIKFRIYTVLYYAQKLLFVLDYLNDKEAIKNFSQYIHEIPLEFFDSNGFQSALTEQKELRTDRTILYGYEKYYELLQQALAGSSLEYICLIKNT